MPAYVDAEIVLRVLVAMILAGIIGWDREHSGHSAGLRTNMLIGLSAALFTATGELLLRYFQSYGSLVHTDPIRVLQAIVLGVSFLGSGIIFVSRRTGEYILPQWPNAGIRLLALSSCSS